ncbi:MAG: hypothetical protein GEU90_12800 [Gemmatimonas sp.]|nr:hypothetical protein [Gemmatimonas sp.]
MEASESLEQFADECGLRLFAEPLCASPRDVLAPLGSVEQHFVVSLTRAGSPEPPVRLVFMVPATSVAEPQRRDVLWWVAGDAWILERSDRDVATWAATFGYPPEEPGTRRLFNQAVRQSAALAALLGESDMRRLMELYGAKVDPYPPST